ncbi:hypothetical protein MLD38_024038 [Melastoma candidum]|uniref:Uncharacterized protein n=1 Tax=Melastoma candidum TaxID=119954 RepID=A0ACB9NR45_9MYRT|nr:hypothetical protein MLD38_024038 [Melastoma candidum]
MRPKLAMVMNKLIRKRMGGSSSNFVADFPVTTREFPPDDHSTDHQTTRSCLACRIFVGTWNVGGISPPARMDLWEDWLGPLNDPSDVYVFGFQELVPLNAGNVLGSESGRVSRIWMNKIREALEQGRSDGSFHCVVSKQMVGIFITVWAREDVCEFISHPNVSCVGCGLMGCLGNKGSASVRFLLRDTSICLVCSHLASGGKEGDERRRNSDAAEILARTSFPRCPSHNLPTKILEHDLVIWLGDLNYRINLPYTTTRTLVEKANWNILLQGDQLKTEFADGRVFQGWQEGTIDFLPTYKYYPNSRVYYGSALGKKSKRCRAPAWCDRIIWFGEGLKQRSYDRGESTLSDHRPVRATFTAEIRQPLE